jgi:glycerol-3-phosphate dehydrogenase
MYAPERLALECLIDAAEHGAALANHVETERLAVRDAKVEGASLRCTLTGDTLELRAAMTIVAAGPSADLFLDRALGKETTHRLMRSKGIHLVVPKVTRGDALTITTPHGHFFVLPWRGRTLLGTTDTPFAGAPDKVGVTEKDIAAFLGVVNAHVPEARLTRRSVMHYYAGLRPLVVDGHGDTYKASRRAELIDHRKSDGIDGLVSAIGGKWTTSRNFAQQAVNLALRKLRKRVGSCKTAFVSLPGGRVGRLSAFRKNYAESAVPNIDHLERLYGTRLNAVLKLAKGRSELSTSLSPSGDIGAQILLAIREEMAMTLEDVAMRRTGIGQLGQPSAQALAATVSIMAQELGWNMARIEAELASLRPTFRPAENEP